MSTTTRVGRAGQLASRLATRGLAGTVAALLVIGGPGLPAYADEVRDNQRQLAELQVRQAHRHSLGAGVTVAVLDSGVDASHPDLRENVLPGVDLTDRGTDGRHDPGGSGTALAGLIAGHGHAGPAAAPTGPPEDGPGEPDQDAEDDQPSPSPSPVGDPVAPDGILGLAPRAAILPVVVAPPGAAPAPATLAAGIDEAVWRGADVICVGHPVPEDQAVSRALGAAVAAGVVVVVPGVPAGDAVARYGGAGLLGAVPAGAPATSRPPGTVAVPSAGILSTGGQGGYFLHARTTEAAATGLLAGAAALVRAAHPGLAAHELTHRLRETTDGGELDLVAALTAEVGAPPDQPPAPPEPGEPAPPDATPAEPDRADQVAAFDSHDWRRRLVGVPLLVFLAILVAVSVAAARRSRRPSR